MTLYCFLCGHPDRQRDIVVPYSESCKCFYEWPRYPKNLQVLKVYFDNEFKWSPKNKFFTGYCKLCWEKIFTEKFIVFEDLVAAAPASSQTLYIKDPTFPQLSCPFCHCPPFAKTDCVLFDDEKRPCEDDTDTDDGGGGGDEEGDDDGSGGGGSEEELRQ